MYSFATQNCISQNICRGSISDTPKAVACTIKLIINLTAHTIFLLSVLPRTTKRTFIVSMERQLPETFDKFRLKQTHSKSQTHEGHNFQTWDPNFQIMRTSSHFESHPRTHHSVDCNNDWLEQHFKHSSLTTYAVRLHNPMALSLVGQKPGQKYQAGFIVNIRKGQNSRLQLD